MIIIIVNALNFKQKKNRLHITIVYTEKLKTIKQTDYYPDQKKAQKATIKLD